MKTLMDEVIKDEQVEEIRAAHPKEYCLDKIRKDGYLWDMRTWKKPKSRKQAEVWVELIKKDVLEKGSLNFIGPAKNCGHAAFCIAVLLIYHKVSKKEIVNVIMNNNIITYMDQINTWGDYWN